MDYEFPVATQYNVYEVVYSIHYNNNVHPEVLICALVYMDRFVCSSNILLTGSTWYRLFVAAYTVAAKMYDDRAPKNSHICQTCADLSAAELAQIETLLVRVLGFGLLVPEAQYQMYYDTVFAAGGLPPGADDRAELSPTPGV